MLRNTNSLSTENDENYFPGGNKDPLFKTNQIGQRVNFKNLNNIIDKKNT